MKSILRLFSLFLFLLTIQPADATHVSGGDMEWEYLGNDSFLVTAYVYRNCNGRALGNQPILISTATCGNKNYSTSLLAMGDITPVCDEQCTRCDSRGCTFKYGIQKWALSTIVVVTNFKKNNCCWVTASWDECCRDNQFTTGAASTTFYMESKFNVCEANPLKVTWQADPVFIVCLGRDLINSSNHLLSDQVSDSIVHSFKESMQTATIKTTWSSPYSYTAPIYYLGFPIASKRHPQGLRLDTLTGTLKFRPMKEEVTLMTIKAEVYRNGKLLGETMREQPVIVMKCPDNNPPTISGMDCRSNRDEDFNIALCNGEKIAFTICATDKDLDDTVTIAYSHNMPGAKVTILDKGTKRESLSFEWTTDTLDSIDRTYTLYVEANDNACPVNGRASRIFRITVNKNDPMSITAVEKDCGNQLLIAKGGSFERFEWKVEGRTQVHTKKTLSNTDSLYYRFNSPGQKVVEAKTYRDGKCAHFSKHSITVNNNFMWVQQTTADTVKPCVGDSIDLGLKIFGTKSTPTTTWNGTDSNKAFTSSRTFSAGSNNEWVRYTVHDGACRIKDSILLQTELEYMKIPESFIGCEGLDSFALTPFLHPSQALDSITSFVWQPSNTTDSIYWASKPETIRLEMKGSNGCTYLDSTQIVYKQAKFRIPSDTSVCPDDYASFSASTSSSGTFDWYFGGINVNNPTYTVLDQTNVRVNASVYSLARVIFTDTVGFKNCAFTDSFSYDFYPEAFIGLSYPDSVCEGDSFEVATRLSTGSWNFQGAYGMGKSTWMHTQAMQPGGRPYTLNGSAVSQYGCAKDTQVLIFVSSKPNVRFTVQDSIFKNWKLQPQNLSSNAAFYRYEWKVGTPAFVFSKDYSPTLRIDSLGIFDLKLRVSHKWNGCTDSVSKSIKVLRGVGSTPTGFKKGMQLFPNPAKQYIFVNWLDTELYQLDIYNATGQLLQTKKGNTGETVLNLNDLAEGIYFIHLQSDGFSSTRTFEVIH